MAALLNSELTKQFTTIILLTKYFIQSNKWLRKRKKRKTNLKYYTTEWN